MRFRLNPTNEIIHANSFTEFVEKYRAGSLQPEESLELFLYQSAKRAEHVGLAIRYSTPDDFVQDLIKEGFVSLLSGDLPC